MSVTIRAVRPSDAAVIENTVSIEAQNALGFIETERVVCFRKPL